ncbi:SigE family RNA polymerase sigma factor [Streptomyces sp. NPDC053048]|uniref:SigE family RNA polymerase sigma factor n=1 Tax=Streptomyces sp. NPDC053048 TaxID=3365694 RepID=UPI0037CEC3E5
MTPVPSVPIPPDSHDSERSNAIANLFVTKYPGMLKLAARLGAEADAEDVVAEAFCQLYKNWDRLRSADAAAGYLRTTVQNLARMRLRHLIVARRYTDPQWDEPAHSAEHHAILRYDQRAVVQALRTLPPRQYQALVLRHWMDLQESQIAETMGISVGAVKSHISRGMTKLTRVMRGENHVVRHNSPEYGAACAAG